VGGASTTVKAPPQEYAMRRLLANGGRRGLKGRDQRIETDRKKIGRYLIPFNL
jgi:hypothetical protein